MDAATLHHVLNDFDTLFTVANANEREQLLKLLIKRIVFRGHDAEVTMELFAGVNLQGGGSNFRALWLRRRVSKGSPEPAHAAPAVSFRVVSDDALERKGIERKDTARNFVQSDKLNVFRRFDSGCEAMASWLAATTHP